MQNLIPAPRFASDKNDPTNPCRHFIRSDAFAAKFSMTTELAVFERISAYIKPMKGGPVGGDTVRFADDNDNGDRHEFSFETFNFGHECLTLAVHQRKVPLLWARNGVAVVLLRHSLALSLCCGTHNMQIDYERVVIGSHLRADCEL